MYSPCAGTLTGIAKVLMTQKAKDKAVKLSPETMVHLRPSFSASRPPTMKPMTEPTPPKIVLTDKARVELLR